jgi:hypothetical protein
VFLFVDIVAELVLLAVHLCLLFVGQVAAIGLTFGVRLLIQLGLFVFEMRRFLRRQRAALYALRDALLLAFFAFCDGAFFFIGERGRSSH